MAFVNHDSLKCQHVKLDFELFERLHLISDFAIVFWFILFLSQIIFVLYARDFPDSELIGNNLILTLLFLVVLLLASA